jgi:MraZ protein
MQLSAFNPKIRALQRFLVGHAEDVVMDAAGRVLISATLRDYAKLEKRVMLVGQGNKFELWDEARWQAQYEKMSGFSTDDLPPELEGFTL